MARANRPLVAVACILGAMLIIGVIDNFVVQIAETAGLWQFHALRAAMALPLIAVLSLAGLGALRPKRPGAVLVRSLLVATAMLLYFGALAFLPIAEVLAGLFTSPIFVLLISVIFLGQRVGPWRLLAVGVGFLGILLVLRPEVGGLSWVSVVPVLAGLLYATGAVLTRQWCAEESTLALLAGFFAMLGLFGLLGLGLLAVFPQEAAPGPDGFVLRGWAAPTAAVWLWTAVQAVGSIIAVGLLIRAYQLAEASYVSVFEYSVMVFGPAVAFVLYGQTVGALGLLGIAMIAGAGIVIALRAR